VRHSTSSVWNLSTCRRRSRQTAGVVSCASTAVSAMDRTTYVFSARQLTYLGHPEGLRCSAYTSSKKFSVMRLLVGLQDGHLSCTKPASEAERFTVENSPCVGPRAVSKWVSV